MDKDLVFKIVKECCAKCGNAGYISGHSVISCTGCGVWKVAEEYGVLVNEACSECGKPKSKNEPCLKCGAE
jgi:hypothetical protein